MVKQKDCIATVKQASKFGVFEKNSRQIKLNLEEKTSNSRKFLKKLRSFSEKLNDDVIFL